MRLLPCHVYAADQRAGKANVCKNIVQKICQKCQMNKVQVECFQVVVDCNMEVSAKLECGHEVTWNCGSEEDPRQNPLQCQPCIYPKWINLINSESSVQNNIKSIQSISKETKQYFHDLAEVKNYVELQLI